MCQIQISLDGCKDILSMRVLVDGESKDYSSLKVGDQYYLLQSEDFMKFYDKTLESDETKVLEEADIHRALAETEFEYPRAGFETRLTLGLHA